MGCITGGTEGALVLTAALLATPGCAPLGEILAEPRFPSARTVVLDGEIRSVDLKKGRIRINTDRRGTRTVNVDRATRVVYQRHEYSIGALERGDLVRVWVELDRSGAAWADRVDVRESVTERRRDRY